MPCYVILDPVGNYAAEMKSFLDRLELPAIVVFTDRMRLAVWEHKWRHRIGEHVRACYLADDETDLSEVAAQIRAESPGGFFGIVLWDEMHTLRGAELGELLGLGWNPRRVIERFRDKYVMKDWLRSRGGVRVNASRVVESAPEALEFQQQVGTWPIVVKPSGGAGSMKVYFAEQRAELLAACQRVLEFGMGEVLLEEFIGGREYAINGVVDKSGALLVTDVWGYDKRTSHGIPNLYYQSVKLGSGEPPFLELARYAAEVVEALELRRSPVHMEAKVDERGPCLIEVGARFAGGDQPTLASKLQGRSLFELAACHYLEELPASVSDVNYERYDHLEARIVSGIQAVEIPKVRAVHGIEEVERPGVVRRLRLRQAARYTPTHDPRPRHEVLRSLPASPGPGAGRARCPCDPATTALRVTARPRNRKNHGVSHPRPLWKVSVAHHGVPWPLGPRCGGRVHRPWPVHAVA